VTVHRLELHLEVDLQWLRWKIARELQFALIDGGRADELRWNNGGRREIQALVAKTGENCPELSCVVRSLKAWGAKVTQNRVIASPVRLMHRDHCGPDQDDEHFWRGNDWGLCWRRRRLHTRCRGWRLLSRGGTEHDQQQCETEAGAKSYSH